MTRHRRVFRLECRFDADFRDLFEVRGMQRDQRGTISMKTRGPDRVVFSYKGLDGIVRQTMLHFEPWPTRLEANRAIYEMALEPDERRSILVTVACEEQKSGEAFSPEVQTSSGPTGTPAEPCAPTTREIARVKTSNQLFNEVISRSSSDMYMLVTPTEHGLYPYAGIPWFSTIFGRDGIITAMMLLWADPSIAKGVLRYLAAMQATDFDPAADAQPGKILHERRLGEMAQLGEVPFRRYYGTVDATPLFVMLAGQYYDRTGDRETIEAIWPNIEAALRWCDEFGDRDGDGFVEYHRETDRGWPIRAGRTATTRSSTPMAQGPKGRSRSARCRPMSSPPSRRPRGLRRALDRADISARLAQEAEQPSGAVRGSVLVRGTGHLCLGARRRQAAVPRADIQCGPCPVRRHCCAGARPPGRGDADEPGLVQRLGHPHRRAGRGALQSDVLSQRLGLAARQRADRLGPGALWLERGGGPDLQGAVRGGHAIRSCAACPSCSAASRAGATAGRRPIRSPARRRPGPRRRPLRPSPRAWGWTSIGRAMRSALAIPSSQAFWARS